GLLAFYSAALDNRIASACVSGYFDDRRNIWKQPGDRNVFGLLDQFGDAEVAAMIAPRNLIVEAARASEVSFSGGDGSPGKLETPKLEVVQAEIERAHEIERGLATAPKLDLIVSGDGTGPFGSEAAL